METTLSKSEIFKMAHEIARDLYEGDYLACFSEALKSVYSGVKKYVKKELDLAKLNVKRIFNILTPNVFGSKIKPRYEYSENALTVLKTVKDNSKGFQSDIAERAYIDGTELSSKQKWCVAYEFLKLA